MHKWMVVFFLASVAVGATPEPRDNGLTAADAFALYPGDEEVIDTDSGLEAELGGDIGLLLDPTAPELIPEAALEPAPAESP